MPSPRELDNGIAEVPSEGAGCGMGAQRINLSIPCEPSARPSLETSDHHTPHAGVRTSGRFSDSRALLDVSAENSY